MKRTLRALWDGELTAIDCYQKTNPNMEDFERLKTKQAAELSQLLTGAAKEQFDRYVRNTDAYAVSLGEQAFATGFSLAVRLMTESLREEWI